MLKFHLFPRDTGIDAVLGPPKLPLGLELRSTALGQFWRPLDGIFSRVPRKKAEFWPRLGYIKVTHAGFTVTDSILVLNVVTSKSCPSSHRPLSYFYLTYILPPSYFYQTCILSISLLTKFGVFPPLRGVTTVFKECRPIKFILIERR